MKTINVYQSELSYADAIVKGNYPHNGIYINNYNVYVVANNGVYRVGIESDYSFNHEVDKGSENQNKGQQDLLLKTIALLTDKAKLSEII